jgi:hypothetical protein
VPVDARAI